MRSTSVSSSRCSGCRSSSCLVGGSTSLCTYYSVSYIWHFFADSPSLTGECPDYFELAVVLGSCFLVNYVTADSKTNWVEARCPCNPDEEQYLTYTAGTHHGNILCNDCACSALFLLLRRCLTRACPNRQSVLGSILANQNWR